MRNTLLTLTLLHFVLYSFSQNMGYGINLPNFIIKKEKVSEAKVITDINPRFPTSWIKEYISVDLSVTCDGEMLSAKGSDFNLNEEQQHILKMGDTGAEIKVAIKYYPDNNLGKEIKDLNFAFTIVPDLDAEFQGGDKLLQQYLKENAIDILPEVSDEELHEAILGFVVTKTGEVSDARILQRSHSKKIDELLLTTINNMPNWIPAKNADGTIVGQSFEFIVTRDLCANKGLNVVE